MADFDFDNDLDDDEYSRRKERNRARHKLLASFYALKDEPGSQDGSGGDGDGDEGAGAQGGSQAELLSPTNLNGHGFEPKVYIQLALREKRLDELLEEHRTVAQEIKSLDNDMQMLVYENYNKFISATDTIRQMKDNVSEMEKQMDLLEDKMSTIAGLNDQVDTALQPSRDKIEQLSGVQRLMKKLEFVFELPGMLTKCLELQSYGQAIEYWQKTEAILQTYSHLPSFQTIHSDCVVILDKLKLQLNEIIAAKRSNANQVSEAVELLLRLRQPEGQLRDAFLECRINMLDAKIDQCRDDLQTQLAAGQTQTPLRKFVSRLATTVFSDFASFYDAFVALFIRREGASRDNRAYFDTYAAKFVAAFNDLVKSAVQGLDNSPEQLIHGLELLIAKVGQAAQRFPSEWRVLEQLQDIVHSTTHADIKDTFGDLASSFDERLVTLYREVKLCSDAEGASASSADASGHNEYASDPSPLFSIARDHTEATVNDVFKTLERLSPYVSADTSNAEFRSMATDVVHVQLQQFFLAMNESISQCCHAIPGSDTSTTRGATYENPRALLTLTALTLSFESHGVGQILAVLEDQFKSSDSSMSLLISTDIIKRFRDTAKRTLAFYVQIQGQKVSQLVRKSMETANWLKEKEPRDVRKVIDFVYRDVFAVEADVAQIFDNLERAVSVESGSSASRRSHDSSRRSMDVSFSGGFGSTRQGSLASRSLDQLNIDRLFGQKIKIFDQVDFSTKGVLTGVVKIFLKSFNESVRMLTFSTDGFRQVQIDVSFLEQILMDLVDDEGLLGHMCSEILYSAMGRCLNPQGMEPKIIEEICAAKRAKLSDA